jgi:hypothetical protein
MGQKVAGMVRDEKGQINFGETIFLKSIGSLKNPRRADYHGSSIRKPKGGYHGR